MVAIHVFASEPQTLDIPKRFLDPRHRLASETRWINRAFNSTASSIL